MYIHVSNLEMCQIHCGPVGNFFLSLMTSPVGFGHKWDGHPCLDNFLVGK